MLNLINPLTVHHLGISTLSCFRPEMDCIGKTLGNMPSSAHERRLLSFIPSLYGHVPSVTYATDCIIARLQQLIRVKDGWSTSRDVASLKPYTKALTALQVAIDDQSLRTLPETLCAVQLLGIFEVSQLIIPHVLATTLLICLSYYTEGLSSSVGCTTQGAHHVLLSSEVLIGSKQTLSYRCSWRMLVPL